jgi:hypothetical protein
VIKNVEYGQRMEYTSVATKIMGKWDTETVKELNGNKIPLSTMGNTQKTKSMV